MYYYFEDPIEKEYINALIEKIDVEEEVHLYFSTEGGYYDVMMFLIDFLNSKENIIVHLVESVMSAGGLLFTEYKGKLILEDGLDCLMFHCFDRRLYTLREDGYNKNKRLTRQTKQLNENFAKKLKDKEILTEKQTKQFLQGKDIIIYKEQFSKYKL